MTKKLLTIALLAFISVLCIAATNPVRHLGERDWDVDLFKGDGSGTPDTVYLDSGEIDTATDVWDMRGTKLSVDANNEMVLGTFTVTCADSSGTDSVDVDMNIQFNYTTGSHSETWTTINTLISTSNDGSAATVTDTTRTPLSPKFLRFVFENDGENVAEKAKCYNMRWRKLPERDR